MVSSKVINFSIHKPVMTLVLVEMKLEEENYKFMLSSIKCFMSVGRCMPEKLSYNRI